MAKKIVKVVTPVAEEKGWVIDEYLNVDIVGKLKEGEEEKKVRFFSLAIGTNNGEKAHFVKGGSRIADILASFEEGRKSITIEISRIQNTKEELDLVF